MTWDGTTLTVNGTILGRQDLFGDGSDGDVTISVNTTLTRDMFYGDLTVNTGVTLTTAGFRVFVKGTLTKTGTIANNGGNGGNGGNGSGVDGGAAGSAGAVAAGGSLPAGEDGKAGGVGGTGNGGGQNGTAGTAGDSAAKSIGSAGVAGGAGGNGGSNLGAAGTGAAGGAAGSKTGTVFNTIRNAIGAYMLIDGQFKNSLALDPDNEATTGDNRAGGILTPTPSAALSAANGTGIDDEPLWMNTTPKDDDVYVYDRAGKVYTVILASKTISDLNNGAALSSSSGNGAAYYDNFQYFAKNTDICRYGRLDGSRSYNQTYWTSTPSKSPLGNGVTYPSPKIGTTKYPNHVMHRHVDGKLYIADVMAKGRGGAEWFNFPAFSFPCFNLFRSLCHRIDTRMTNSVVKRMNAPTHRLTLRHNWRGVLLFELGDD